MNEHVCFFHIQNSVFFICFRKHVPGAVPGQLDASDRVPGGHHGVVPALAGAGEGGHGQLAGALLRALPPQPGRAERLQCHPPERHHGRGGRVGAQVHRSRCCFSIIFIIILIL